MNNEFTGLGYSSIDDAVEGLALDAQTMETLLSELSNEMVKMKSVLQSLPAEEKYALFDNLKPRMETYPQKVKEFSQTLKISKGLIKSGDETLNKDDTTSVNI